MKVVSVGRTEVTYEIGMEESGMEESGRIEMNVQSCLQVGDGMVWHPAVVRSIKGLKCKTNWGWWEVGDHT